MRLTRAAAILLVMSGTAMAECPIQDIEKALNLPLDGFTMTEQPVEDIQSTEGGVWRIYSGASGNVQSIIRIDAGESGMGERRLGIHSPTDYGITVTRVDYLRHAFIEEAGPNGTAKRTTEYFYFCNGKLFMPPEQFSMLDPTAYAKAGSEAQALMLGSQEISAAVKSIKR